MFENTYSTADSSIKIKPNTSSRCKKQKNKENGITEFNTAVKNVVILPPELTILKEASNESPLIRGRISTEGP